MAWGAAAPESGSSDSHIRSSLIWPLVQIQSQETLFGILVKNLLEPRDICWNLTANISKDTSHISWISRYCRLPIWPKLESIIAMSRNLHDHFVTFDLLFMQIEVSNHLPPIFKTNSWATPTLWNRVIKASFRKWRARTQEKWIRIVGNWTGIRSPIELLTHPYYPFYYNIGGLSQTGEFTREPYNIPLCEVVILDSQSLLQRPCRFTELVHEWCTFLELQLVQSRSRGKATDRR